MDKNVSPIHTEEQYGNRLVNREPSSVIGATSFLSDRFIQALKLLASFFILTGWSVSAFLNIVIVYKMTIIVLMLADTSIFIVTIIGPCFFRSIKNSFTIAFFTKLAAGVLLRMKAGILSFFALFMGCPNNFETIDLHDYLFTYLFNGSKRHEIRA